MGTLLRNCAEVREPIELSVGTVSGVGGGMGILDGVYVPERHGQFWGFIDPVGFKSIFNKNVFNSCVTSSQYFHTDNISLESWVQWHKFDPKSAPSPLTITAPSNKPIP